ncbi:MAG: sn-glycerol-1-phosphate dehydrogenase [Clostridia bacterium]|nr:sn-glycerol-1-phosphate dehydrogenase [Clostridia bacterium]
MIEFDCSCKMGKHSAPVDDYVIEQGAIKKLPEMIKDYKKVYMVCDNNTYKAAGEKVKEMLEVENKLFSFLMLPDDPLPDYKTIGNILIHANNPGADSDIFEYSPLPDLILAVGSGTINDSCRLVSYRLGIPYGVVGTAPSMDGYLSAGSPTLFDGSKSTIKCTTPKFLIADTDIIKDAPWDMLLAGIGDMFGKYTGILDWELARDYNGDYYCEKIADDVIKATDSCLYNGYKLKDRDPECIKNVMEGFVVTGLGMAYTGNSRPASGSEHIVAHAWELEDVKEGKKPNLHGLEVCEATRLIADMYLMLMEETEDQHLKNLISKYTGYFEAVEKFCVEMKVPSPADDVDKIVNSVLKALKMRDRYTILFYLDKTGQLERYARICAEKLVKRL